MKCIFLLGVWGWSRVCGKIYGIGCKELYRSVWFVGYLLAKLIEFCFV